MARTAATVAVSPRRHIPVKGRSCCRHARVTVPRQDGGPLEAPVARVGGSFASHLSDTNSGAYACRRVHRPTVIASVSARMTTVRAANGISRRTT